MRIAENGSGAGAFRREINLRELLIAEDAAFRPLSLRRDRFEPLMSASSHSVSAPSVLLCRA